METIVLASASPRRSELLTRCGIPFEVFATQVDERCDGPASSAVCILSQRKALAVRERFPSRFILAADTLVELDGAVLGKPSSASAAVEMLRKLSGHTHQVYTGVTVISPGGEVFTEGDRTDVTFCAIPEAEISSYVLGGEPLDKAGAYALQGRAGLWVTRLEGSDSSVIGLPLHLVRSLLLRAGWRFADSEN